MTVPPVGASDAPRRPRWGRRAFAAAAVLAIPCWFAFPRLARRLDFFRVSEVEVRGARFTKPAEVVAALRIDTTFSVWNATDELAARVAKHPQVLTAHVSRRLPNALVVDITERVPVAFVQERNGLRAYDAVGRALPLDPSRSVADVPIVSQRDTVVLALLADLMERAPEVYARVSEVHAVGRNQLRLMLVDVAVIAMRDVSANRFLELSSVEADLLRRQLKPVELDLRFKDQVIARMP
jgi:cell division protein FtsQ